MVATPDSYAENGTHCLPLLTGSQIDSTNIGPKHTEDWKTTQHNAATTNSHFVSNHPFTNHI